MLLTGPCHCNLLNTQKYTYSVFNQTREKWQVLKMYHYKKKMYSFKLIYDVPFLENVVKYSFIHSFIHVSKHPLTVSQVPELCNAVTRIDQVLSIREFTVGQIQVLPWTIWTFFYLTVIDLQQGNFLCFNLIQRKLLIGAHRKKSNMALEEMMFQP